MGGDIKGKIWGGNNLKNEIMPQDIYTVFSAKEKDSRIIFHLYFHRLQLLGFEKTVNSSQIVYNNFHLFFFMFHFFFHQGILAIIKPHHQVSCISNTFFKVKNDKIYQGAHCEKI